MKIKIGITSAVTILVGIIVFCAYNTTPATRYPLPALIPLPVEVKHNAGCFKLDENTKLYFNEDLQGKAELLRGYIANATDFPLEPTSSQTSKNTILLKIDESLTDLGDEGYNLSITPDQIVIAAHNKQGVYYGITTLLQLFPPGILSSTKAENISFIAPCVEIKDYPRFGWRGMMLDSARAFQNVEFIKKYIDGLALHKINIFHWHLTDDQGWRIEIKAYPKFTEIGSKRYGHGSLKQFYRFRKAAQSGEEYGGYYTQDDIRKIVAYAAKRNVNILPEIDFPGHSGAAAKSYPEIACSNTKLRPNVWCASREDNYKMIDQIIREVSELFPFGYIHVGGDEVDRMAWRRCSNCPKLAKLNKGQIQPYFTARLEQICKNYNRKIIGWHEIMNDSISKEIGVISWNGTSAGYNAAKKGHPAIMAPGRYLFFDMAQSAQERGHTWAGIVTAERMYSFKPISDNDLTLEQQKNIKGVQGCLWTEYCVESTDDTHKNARRDSKHSLAPKGFTEYQTYPRLLALSELAWTPQAKRSLSDFLERMPSHFMRLDNLGINYRIPPPRATYNNNIVKIESPLKGADIIYTLDGTAPVITSPIYKEPFPCDDILKIKSAVKAPNGEISTYIKGANLAPHFKWTNTDISSENSSFEFDVTDIISDSGYWHVAFKYTWGTTALNIKSVSLLQDNKLLSEDKHEATLEIRNVTDNGRSIYNLHCNKFDENANYTLRIAAKGVGGPDNTGSFNISRSPWIEPVTTIETDIIPSDEFEYTSTQSWNRQKYFVSRTKLEKGQTFTWKFNEPIASSIIEVVTGGATVEYAILEAGRLQASADGINFDDVAKFENGIAKASIKKSIRALRMIADKPNTADLMVIAPPYIQPASIEYDAKISTSLPTYMKHTPPLAKDNSHRTYFWSRRPVKQDDHMTWGFISEVNAQAIAVYTGSPLKEGKDLLQHGALQVSYDGTNFEDLAILKNGVAKGKLSRPIRAARLLATEGQLEWLIIRDLFLE